MSGSQLHAVLSPLAIIGSLGVALLLLVALLPAGRAFRRLALTGLVLVALLGAAAFLSGSGALGDAASPTSAAATRLAEHADMAMVALAGLGLAGAIGLAGLVSSRRRTVPASLLVVALIVDLGAAALLTRVATLGSAGGSGEATAGEVAPPLPGD